MRFFTCISLLNKVVSPISVALREGALDVAKRFLLGWAFPRGGHLPANPCLVSPRGLTPSVVGNSEMVG